MSEQDDRAWTSALATLIESPARRSDLVARGRERAASHFAWSVVGRKTLAFIEKSAVPAGAAAD